MPSGRTSQELDVVYAVWTTGCGGVKNAALFGRKVWGREGGWLSFWMAPRTDRQPQGEGERARVGVLG